MDYRTPIQARPKHISSGEVGYLIPQNLLEKRDEIALSVMLCSDRRLFGRCYQGLVGEFFESLRPGSGVMIAGNVPMERLLPDVKFPGDIDLLIIPYQDDELLLSSTLALEVKAVRASYARQSKSPNQFGFSQAQALSDCGFPFVGVAHLITSDASPSDAWRKGFLVRVVDADSGLCEEIGPKKVDFMPIDLIDRTYGRLLANSPNSALGLVAAYISVEADRYWMPTARVAELNPAISIPLLDAIDNYYHANVRRFLDTRTYPPAKRPRDVAAV